MPLTRASAGQEATSQRNLMPRMSRVLFRRRHETAVSLVVLSWGRGEMTAAAAAADCAVRLCRIAICGRSWARLASRFQLGLRSWQLHQSCFERGELSSPLLSHGKRSPGAASPNPSQTQRKTRTPLNARVWHRASFSGLVTVTLLAVSLQQR